MLRRSMAVVYLHVAAALCGVASASRALAETNEIDAVTLGALSETAGAVVVATVTDAATVAGNESPVWSLRVDEAILGATKDAVLRVRVAPGRAPVAKGGRFLAFLRPEGDGAWTPLALPWSLRATAEDGTAELIAYVRGYVACLGADRRIARPEELAAFLVASLASDAGGVPFCAGRDLVRHADELRAAVTADQRDRVTAALAKPRKPDQDLVSIVLASGPFGGAGADDALIARLLDPRTRPLRRHIVRSMAVRASAGLAAKLAARVSGADPAQRADIANAIGRLDQPEAATTLLALLRDDVPAVRVESAHGLGLLARAIREPQPDVDPDAPRPKLRTALAPLLAAVAAGTTENERRATTWALGQIDVPEAWEALRGLTTGSPDLRVRELAQRVLDRPRSALLLE